MESSLEELLRKEGFKGRPRKAAAESSTADTHQSNYVLQHTTTNGKSKHICSEKEKYSKEHSTRENIKQLSRKSYGYTDNQKRFGHPYSQPELALDEVAIKALISVLTGYIKSFIKDEEFRTTLYHNCFSSLGLGFRDEDSLESKILSNLEQAINTIESVVDDSLSTKQLRKTSLQLSLITGFNQNDEKDGVGVPVHSLSACAHLYLSVIYILQSKERASAKHLLQVFCDSPFLARTTLLPEVWARLFSQHLSHLIEWYNKESSSGDDELRRPRKGRLLTRIYDETMDSGTYELAVYYRDWLTDGVEAPCLVPCIKIPSAIFLQGGSFSDTSGVDSPASRFSPQAMVSKRLYDSVIGQLHKPIQMNDDAEEEEVDKCTYKDSEECSSSSIQYSNAGSS